jgi:hypothetical protein
MARFTERSRLQRIERLIAKLDADQDIQKRDLDAVLTAEQRESFAAAWEEQRANRRPPKPAEIAEYERLLAKADLAYGKFDAYSSRTASRSNMVVNRRVRARALGGAADTAYERALEHLQAILELDPSLCVWLDRTVDFSAANAPTLDPPSMPRAVTSRSLNRLSSVSDRFGEVMTKRELKRRALAEALKGLRGGTQGQELGEADRAKLARLLGKIKQVR